MFSGDVEKPTTSNRPVYSVPGFRVHFTDQDQDQDKEAQGSTVY